MCNELTRPLLLGLTLKMFLNLISFDHNGIWFFEHEIQFNTCCLHELPAIHCCTKPIFNFGPAFFFCVIAWYDCFWSIGNVLLRWWPAFRGGKYTTSSQYRPICRLFGGTYIPIPAIPCEQNKSSPIFRFRLHFLANVAYVPQMILFSLTNSINGKFFKVFVYRF